MERPAAGAALDDRHAETRESRPAEPARGRSRSRRAVRRRQVGHAHRVGEGHAAAATGLTARGRRPEPRPSRLRRTATSPRRLRGRSGAMARSSVLPRGGAKSRSARRTHGPSRRRRRRRPGPRLRETADRNRASDRYPQRLGRVLPGGGRSRSRRRPTAAIAAKASPRPPETRPGGGAQWGGWGAGTIDHHVTRPLAPSAPRSPSRPPSPRWPAREKLRALCAPFFCRAVRGKGTNGTTGERPHDPQEEEQNDDRR